MPRPRVQPILLGKSGITIHFTGSPGPTVLRPIDYYRADINENSFRVLPTGYFITDIPFIHDKRYEFDEYKTWNGTWFTESTLVFYAENRPSSVSSLDDAYDRSFRPRRFALKVSFCVDGLLGGSLLQYFRDEAVYHRDHLTAVEGVVVPKHYGVWLGVSSWGVPIAVSIMEWGGYPYIRWYQDTIVDTIEVKLKIVHAYKRLHDAGIVHGDYNQTSKGHVLWDNELKKVSIISYGMAETGHKCGLRMELKEYASFIPPDVFGCDELQRICLLLGLIAGDKVTEEITAAIEAYDEEMAAKRAGKRGANEDKKSDNSKPLRIGNV